jgi:hypothetical protein
MSMNARKKIYDFYFFDIYFIEYIDTSYYLWYNTYIDNKMSNPFDFQGFAAYYIFAFY